MSRTSPSWSTAPQEHPLPGDSDDHLVEVRSRARAWAALPQLACDRRAEFQHPAPHRFIRDVVPTLGEQFLHVSVAQREAETKPDRVLNGSRPESDDGDTKAEPWLMMCCPSLSLDPHSCDKPGGKPSSFVSVSVP